MAEHGERFTGRVEVYARFRQGYPDAVLQVLRERCDLAATTRIADIGAGTGMVAELLLRAGCTVTAVEPNAEMRAQCASLLYDRLRVVDATAEATGLAVGSIDLVTVGRAFHWFDKERALAEFERILAPGGWLVLLSNRRDEQGSAQAEEYEAILREHGNDYEVMRRETRKFDGMERYGEGERFAVMLPGEQSLTLEEFLGQTQSYSVAPLPGQAKYDGMQKALRAYFAKWSRDGRLAMATRCDIAGWRRPASHS